MDNHAIFLIFVAIGAKCFQKNWRSKFLLKNYLLSKKKCMNRSSVSEYIVDLKSTIFMGFRDSDRTAKLINFDMILILLLD
jgi:hypothetical protein